jgi:glycosyltransferase involved in cell wall biosynthesis
MKAGTAVVTHLDNSSSVSVVIPTRGRALLVNRAVESALAQTHSPIEVIVVIDGIDTQTEQVLSGINDHRLRVVLNAVSQGGAETRNLGVRQASGTWIAFLDDDDEWLPEKLEKQITLLLASGSAHPIGVCRLIARRDGGDSIWPFRMPAEGEPLSEYLLCRKSLGYGEGIIQTSSIVAQRELLLSQPFRKLARHQDWDWTMRVSSLPGVCFAWVWEPLVIFNLESGRGSINRRSSWAESLQWARGNPLLTSRAFSYFAAIQIAPRLNLLRDFRRMPGLLADLSRYGRFEPRAIAYGLLFAFMPLQLLKKVSQSNILMRWRRSESPV